MARGKKTSDQKKEEVKAVLYINPNATGKEIAQITKLPERTAYDLRDKVINEDADTFAALRNKKKEEFIDEAWNVVTKIMLTADKKIDMLLRDPESLSKANIRDIAIALGTIYDKQALAAGEPTNITERQEPVQELIRKLETKMQEYKKLTSN